MTRHSLADSFEYAISHPEPIAYGMLAVAIMVALAYVKGRIDNR
jgi:hypothetical protein